MKVLVLFRREKRLLQSLFLIVVMGFVALPYYAQNTETEKPLILEEVLTSLRASKTGLPTTNRILVQKVKTRGVNFTFSGEVEKDLIAAGANADLMAEIKFKTAGFFTN